MFIKCVEIINYSRIYNSQFGLGQTRKCVNMYYPMSNIKGTLFPYPDFWVASLPFQLFS